VPTFSVVIRAYQTAATVGEAVESALDQTVPPLEVIVVDDGSTDEIRGALRPYAERIVLIHTEHAGGAPAFNTGVNASSGEFVSILDADDKYEPARIEALAALASERPDLDLLMTDVHLEVEGRIVGSFCTETPFAAEGQAVEILDRCFVVSPAVRRSRLLAVGGFDASLSAAHDWECWIRLILAGAQVGLVDSPLYRYRIHAGSLGGNRAASLRARVAVLEGLEEDETLDGSQRQVLKRSLASNRRRALLAEAESALRNGDPDVRRRSLAVAAGRGFGFGTRAKAVAAALAPRAAGRRLTAKEVRTGWSRLQRGHPRD